MLRRLDRWAWLTLPVGTVGILAGYPVAVALVGMLGVATHVVAMLWHGRHVETNTGICGALLWLGGLAAGILAG